MDAVRPRRRCGYQRNLHFAVKTKTPGIPAIRKICISCFDAAIASTIIYIFLSKLYHATRKNAIPAMRISMRFNPTNVTNFVGLVFCTFVQRFRSSENTFFENFCRSRTQADNEMQISPYDTSPSRSSCRVCSSPLTAR